MPPYWIPIKEEGGEEEICRNDCYINENVHEAKERKKYWSRENTSRNGEIYGREYISSRKFIDDVVIDGKYCMKHYFQESTESGKSFNEKRVYKEIGETCTKRLEDDCHKRYNEDIL